MDWIIPILAIAALAFMCWVVRKNMHWDSESERKKTREYNTRYHERPRR